MEFAPTTTQDFKIKGLKYSCLDEFKTSEVVELICYPMFSFNLNKWYLTLRNGVTGYESLSMSKRTYEGIVEQGKPWAACWGTKGVWDKLDVPNGELLKAFKFYGFIK